MKKLLAILLAAMMLLACTVSAMADEGSEPDWSEYNALIAEVKSETDFAAREAKMHQAEDILMATGAILPIYYYNDLYMQKPGVDGITPTCSDSSSSSMPPWKAPTPCA